MSMAEEIFLRVHAGEDHGKADDETTLLISDINEVAPSEFIARRPTAPRSDEPTKGDPITIGAIVLAAVGGGGALAKGFAPNGFFSKVAEIFKERAAKGTSISITDPDGTEIRLVGTAENIIKILKSQSRRR